MEGRTTDTMTGKTAKTAGARTASRTANGTAGKTAGRSESKTTKRPAEKKAEQKAARLADHRAKGQGKPQTIRQAGWQAQLPERRHAKLQGSTVGKRNGGKGGQGR